MKLTELRTVGIHLIVFLFLSLLFSCGKKEYPKDNALESELHFFRTTLKETFHGPMSDSLILQTFESYTLDLLNKWERNAPQEVKTKIKILHKGELISSADAAIELSEMGAYAKGACMALMNTLGNAYLIRHGDIQRLFGAKDFTAGENAVEAFYAIGEPAVPALILSLYLPFDDPEKTFGEYRKTNANITLQKLSGKDFPYDPLTWITWYTTTQDKITIKNDITR